jgi:hypothetical protein
MDQKERHLYQDGEIEAIRLRLDQGERVMEALEKDLAPLNKMYYGILGCGAVATLLCTVLIFVNMSDRAENHAMREALLKQGNAIERLLASQESIQRDIARLYGNRQP